MSLLAKFAGTRFLVEKVGTFDQVDYENGVAYGFAIVSTENGRPYFDLQGDHIPEDAMVSAATEFFAGARVGKDQHSGEQVGDLVFGIPVTKALADAQGMTVTKTGLLVGYKPQDPVHLDMIASGERTGFSIGGILVEWEEMEVGKAVWSQAMQDKLPDSAFLYIKPGGKKDSDGKTTPRGNRMFPVKDGDGKVDQAHVDNALSRVAGAKIPDAAKDKVRAAATKLQDKPKVGKGAYGPSDGMGTDQGGAKPKKKGRVFKTFKIGEISLVDRPAQEGATVTMVKSLATVDITKSIVLTDPAAGHQHVLYVDELADDEYACTSHDYTSPDDEFCHSHRAVIKDGKVILSANAGHTHKVKMPDTWFPPVGRVDDDSEDAGGGPYQPGVTVTIEQAAARAVLTAKSATGSVQSMTEAEIAALNARLARAEKLAEMTDAQRAYHKRLDAIAGSAFLGKSLVSMDEEIKGAVVFKSATGVSYYSSDDPRVVSMARDNEVLQKRLADETALRKAAEIEKRAGDIAGALPGDKESVIALVTAIDGIADDKVRAGVEKMLKAANASMELLMTAQGSVGDGDIGATPAQRDVNKEYREGVLDFAKAGNIPHATEVDYAKASHQFMRTPKGAQLYKATLNAAPVRAA